MRGAVAKIFVAGVVLAEADLLERPVSEEEAVSCRRNYVEMYHCGKWIDDEAARKAARKNDEKGRRGDKADTSGTPEGVMLAAAADFGTPVSEEEAASCRNNYVEMKWCRGWIDDEAARKAARKADEEKRREDDEKRAGIAEAARKADEEERREDEEKRRDGGEERKADQSDIFPASSLAAVGSGHTASVGVVAGMFTASAVIGLFVNLLMGGKKDASMQKPLLEESVV